MRAMQCMQFHAKSVEHDLKPMDFLKCNFLLKRREYLAPREQHMVGDGVRHSIIIFGNRAFTIYSLINVMINQVKTSFNTCWGFV